MNNTEEQISDLEDRIMKINQSEQQTEKEMGGKKQNKTKQQYKRANITCANLHMLGIPEGEETEKRIKNVFAEIMTENFPNIKKETDIQVQEAQRYPQHINPNNLQDIL